MPRFVLWIWRACAIHLAIGMAAYIHFLLTGSYRYLNWYFLIFGTLFLLATSAAEFLLAFECRSGFDADEPMRLVWTFIALAALVRFAGSALIALDHWRNAPSTGSASSVLTLLIPRGLAEVGEVVGGPIAMIFLAFALHRVLQVQRRFGVLRHVPLLDWLLIGLIVVLMVAEGARILRYIHPPYPTPTLSRAILWMSDPLLGLLLVQAVLIRRSTIRVGIGLVSQCWGMYVLAILITLAGDLSIWAVGEELLSEQLAALSWYIWFFAAAAFASAPAYQLAAMKLPVVPRRRASAS